MQYIFEVGRKITNHQSKAVSLIIANTEPRLFVPIVFNFIGDNEELNELCCIKCSSGTNRKCRVCDCERDKMNAGYVGDNRNVPELEYLGIKSELDWKEQIKSKKRLVSDNINNLYTYLGSSR